MIKYILILTSIFSFSQEIITLEKAIEYSLENSNKIYYDILIWFLVVGSLAIIIIFGNKLTQLVDLATTISFMIAPLVALANYKLVSYPFIDENAIPPRWLRNLALGGIIYLVSFGLLFIYVKIIL